MGVYVNGLVVMRRASSPHEASEGSPTSDPATYPLGTVRVAPLGSTRAERMLADHVE
jgi:hypothetical protein